jgi:hypothetical protein
MPKWDYDEIRTPPFTCDYCGQRTTSYMCWHTAGMAYPMRMCIECLAKRLKEVEKDE